MRYGSQFSVLLNISSHRNKCQKCIGLKTFHKWGEDSIKILSKANLYSTSFLKWKKKNEHPSKWYTESQRQFLNKCHILFPCDLVQIHLVETSLVKFAQNVNPVESLGEGIHSRCLYVLFSNVLPYQLQNQQVPEPSSLALEMYQNTLEESPKGLFILLFPLFLLIKKISTCSL